MAIIPAPQPLTSQASPLIKLLADPMKGKMLAVELDFPLPVGNIITLDSPRLVAVPMKVPL